jgi:hypothetical protein
VANLLASFLKNRKYKKIRANRGEPRGVGQALSIGFNGLGEAAVDGFLGLMREPWNGYQERGAIDLKRYWIVEIIYASRYFRSFLSFFFFFSFFFFLLFFIFYYCFVYMYIYIHFCFFLFLGFEGLLLGLGSGFLGVFLIPMLGMIDFVAVAAIGIKVVNCYRTGSAM